MSTNNENNNQNNNQNNNENDNQNNNERDAKITELTEALKNLQDQNKTMAEFVALFKTEAEKNAKKLQVMEMRLTESKGHSIHLENEYVPKDIHDDLPTKIILQDLPKFKGHENPLVHIRAFKGQMSIKGVKRAHWPTFFPHSLDPIPQSWFYNLDPTDVEI